MNPLLSTRPPTSLAPPRDPDAKTNESVGPAALTLEAAPGSSGSVEEPRLRVLYPVVGALVGLAIEAGLLAVRLLDAGQPFHLASVRTEIVGAAATYIYLALVLSSSLALLGAIIGRKEDALRATSVTDSLTRVVNRRGFDEALALEVARSNDAGMPLALMILDVDHFKSLNDEHGHKMGDRALRVVADVLRVTCRSRDLPARFGGDEFVVLAPRTTAAEATVLAERIRVALANLTSTSELGRPLSVSIGVADLEATRVATPAALLDAADRALYRAKTAGRGRVVCMPRVPLDGDDDSDPYEETITKAIRCAAPVSPCLEDSNRPSARASWRSFSCAANTNFGAETHADRGAASEIPPPRVSEIRPLAKAQDRNADHDTEADSETNSGTARQANVDS